MSKRDQRDRMYRDRLFQILAELLRDSGPYTFREKAEIYGVTERTIRKNIDYLIQSLNEPNQRKYIIKGRGYYKGNFKQAVANLRPEVRLYLFLALQQLQPMLTGQGEKAYRELMNFVFSILSEEDIKRLKGWKEFYYINQYGFPLNRNHFYDTLHEIFEAIRLHQILQFKRPRGTYRYFDPYGVYHTKNTFYIIGLLMPARDQYETKQLRHTRLDRMEEVVMLPNHSLLHKNKEELRIYKKNQAKAYIAQMLEAEHDGNRQDYVIQVFDEAVFRRIKERQWHPKQVIQRSEKRGVVGEIIFPQVASWWEVKKWVLGWGSAVELIEPRDKRIEIKEEIKMLFDRYHWLDK